MQALGTPAPPRGGVSAGTEGSWESKSIAQSKIKRHQERSPQRQDLSLPGSSYSGNEQRLAERPQPGLAEGRSWCQGRWRWEKGRQGSWERTVGQEAGGRDQGREELAHHALGKYGLVTDSVTLSESPQSTSSCYLQSPRLLTIVPKLAGGSSTA